MCIFLLFLLWEKQVQSACKPLLGILLEHQKTVRFYPKMHFIRSKFNAFKSTLQKISIAYFWYQLVGKSINFTANIFVSVMDVQSDFCRFKHDLNSESCVKIRYPYIVWVSEWEEKMSLLKNSL